LYHFCFLDGKIGSHAIDTFEPSIILGQFFFGFVFALTLTQINIEHHANSNPEFMLTVQAFQLFLWIVVVGILF
jgi:hypothetical protein